MADEKNYLDFKVDYDPAGAKKVQQDLTKFQKLEADNQKQLKAGAEAEKQLSTALRDRLGVQTSNAASMKALVDDQAKLRKAFQDATGAIKEETDSLKDYEKAGDLASALKFTGGLGTVFGVGAGQYASAFGDVTEAAAQLPKLKDALKDLPAIAQSAAQALGPEGLGLAAVVAAFVISVQIAAQSIQDQIDAVNAETKAVFAAKRDVAGQVRSGTTVSEAQNQLAQLKQQLADEQAALDEATRKREEGFKQATQTWLGDPGTRIIEAISHPFSAFDDEITTASTNVQNITAQIAALQKALDEGKFAADTAKTGMFDLKGALTGLASGAEEYAKKVVEAVQRERDRRAQVNLQFDQRELTAQENLADNLVKIADDAKAKVKDINKQIAELAPQRAQELAAASGKADQAKLDEFHKFAQADQKAFQEYIKNEKRIRDAAKLQRLREIEDENNALLDAEASNDVLRYVQEKKNRDLAIKREAQDQDLAAQQRAEDYAAQQADRKTAYDQRLVEIQNSLQAETATIKQQYDDRRATLLQQIQATNDQAKAAAQTVVKSYQDSINALEKQRQSALHNSMDYDRQQLQMEAHAQSVRLSNIQDEIQALGLVGFALDDLKTKADNLAGGWSGSGSSSHSSYQGLGTSAARAHSAMRSGGYLFDDPGGTIVPAGVHGVGVFGKNRGFAEAVVPLHGMPLGGMNFQWQGDILVGQVATPDDVKRQVVAGLSEFEEDILNGIDEARNNPRRNM